MFSQTITDIVVDSPDHNTLEAALIAANLAEILDTPGEFTVFAPTDAAFDALPAGALDELLMEPSGELTNILLYHVVEGTAFSGDLSDGQMIGTLAGSDVNVSIVDGSVFINSAQVIVADIEATNGVVHVIDAILIPEVPEPNITEIVVNSPDHEILEAAVIAADLAGTLASEGPFTVFAPTDAAFEELPDGLLDMLLEEPGGQLTDILLYHVLSGEVRSTDLSDGQMAETLAGLDITVTIDNGMVMINDAMVTVADIEAANGVVHVIDAVLVPAVPEPTITEIVVNSPDHEILEAAVIAADLAGTLASEGPFTVFAPTDAAFEELPDGLLDMLLEEPGGQLTDILLYHVLSGEVRSTDLSDGQMAETLAGLDITVTIDNGMVMINDAMVTVADIEAANGVVHVIDAVLVPAPEATVFDIIVESPDHEILETAVIAADLAGTLSSEGPFTVFAPTDAAFGVIPQSVLDMLLEEPEGDLTDILLYHVIGGATVLSTDLSDGQTAETLEGSDITVSIDSATGAVMINEANVVVADLMASNGVVHVIDAVLQPSTDTAIEDILIGKTDLYPNPASDLLTIEFPESQAGQDWTITIVDVSGAVLMNTQAQNLRVQMDVSELPTGAYFLQLQTEKRSITERLCIIR